MSSYLIERKTFPTFPEIRLQSGFISYPDRGEGGKSNWRGNFSPKLVEDLITHFQPKHILDPMVGNGTSSVVAQELGVSGEFLDLNPKWGGFDLINDELPCSSNLIIWLPPYWDMVVYSGNEWGEANPRDLSRVGSWEQFIRLINKCTAKLITALRKNGRLAILVGDIKRKGKLYSMLKSMDWYGTPENVVPKFQHGAMSFRKDYGKGKFIPITCEYLMIFKREDCYLIPVVTGKGFDLDLRTREKITWRDMVHSSLEKLGGKADLKTLYSEIEGHLKTKKNKHWREKVRQVLQQSKDFVSLKRGIWQFCY